MAHLEQQQFCQRIKQRFPDLFKSKSVLDIGSLDINGSNRFLFEDCDYVGLDVGLGPNVDVACIADQYDAPSSFFDVIISTEVFEHDMFYQDTIRNVIRMLKPNGAFVFTCAAPPRAEHGTRRSDGSYAAPLLISRSEEWSDYYKNLTKEDFTSIAGFIEAFPDGEFIHDQVHGDLYFFGVKGGTRRWLQLNRQVTPSFFGFDEDVFVIDSWPDTKEKENALIECIHRLRHFSIPIVLVGHYPVPPEIQKLVDYYLFDAKNPVLLRENFDDYAVSSGKWSTNGDWKFTAEHHFHHDYAIWETMRNAFRFCLSLGKKYVHFFEYDCLIEPLQYKQAFLDKIRHHDAVIWEYSTGSSRGGKLDDYCSTFIFSVRPEVALAAISKINSLSEYFTNRPGGWQLERSFLRELRKVTQNIVLSEYIDHNHTLNTHAVWNRDGIVRDGAYFQIYRAIDSSGGLYLHTISGFHERPADADYLIEIRYREQSILHSIIKGAMDMVHLGEYRKGEWIRVFYNGQQILEEFLYRDFEKELPFGNVAFSSDLHPSVSLNLINGCTVNVGSAPTGRRDRYRVSLINQSTGETEYSTELGPNCWATSSARYFKPWKIVVSDSYGTAFFEKTVDLTGQRVLIGLDSKSIGDTIAWLPMVDRFQQKHSCEVIVSTFHNWLFEKSYPNLKFVSPGEVVYDLYAQYSIGIWYDETDWSREMHPSNPFKCSLQGVAAEILGVDSSELKPRLDFSASEPFVKQKYVCIAPHSTSQAKYWNHLTGWQELIAACKNAGYEVVYCSHESPNDPVMIERTGKLEGIIDRSGLPLHEVMNDIANCEVFIGISSGLSWLAWALGAKTVLISGFTAPSLEFKPNHRIFNSNVCNDCWSRHFFDKGDWNWCPDKRWTSRQFECTKKIEPQEVIDAVFSVLELAPFEA